MMLPVGHYTGSEHPPGHRTIRVGRTRVSFPDDAPFLVWAAAHRPPGDLAAPWGRAEIAAASRVDDPDPIIDDLLRDGLLVELVDPLGQEEFARAYKAVPILIALGNTPEDPDRFGIGLFGLDPVITVPPRVFEVWQWGAVGASLWTVCEAFAAASTHATGEPVTTADVLGGFVHALPALVGSNALYLDVVEA